MRVRAPKQIIVRPATASGSGAAVTLLRSTVHSPPTRRPYMLWPYSYRSSLEGEYFESRLGGPMAGGLKDDPRPLNARPGKLGLLDLVNHGVLIGYE